MTSRQRKALLVYLSRKIVPLGDDVYTVAGRRQKDGTRGKTYVVQPNPKTGRLQCQCDGCQETGRCKHLTAVERYLDKGPPSEPYTNLREDRRPTYRQDPVRYPAAQPLIIPAIPVVARDLAIHCFPVPRSRHQDRRGRPNIWMSDVLVCIILRTLVGRGARRVQGVVWEQWESKLLHRPVRKYAAPPAASTITRLMREAHVHEALKSLIRAMNEPYAGNKTDVIIDGTEFEIPNEVAGPNKILRKSSVKAIITVSREDGMILEAEVVPGKAHEHPHTIPMVERVRANRFVVSLIGDKAYVSDEVLAYGKERNIRIVVPPKSNTSRKGDGDLAQHARDWDDRSPEECELYGKRQLVESANSRLKRSAFERVRGLTFDAQVGEVLGKVAYENLSWLISKYVYGEVELPWLSDRARRILDETRDGLKDLPAADRSPVYRDGLPQKIAADDAAA